VGAKITTVATLSQDLVEALHEDQNVVEYPHSNDLSGFTSSVPRAVDESLYSSHVAMMTNSTLSFHECLPDPDSSSIDPSQSASKMSTSTPSFFKPTNQSTSCVIRRLIHELY
jgi:hypothetical protein